MRRLPAERHAWEEIGRDAALIPNAVEEVLRFRTPTASTSTGGMPRSTSPSGRVRTIAWARRWLASRRAVLEELSARLPSLRLVAGQTLRFQPNTSFRGPLALLIEWDT
jgi:cytochrome P450